ncbi:hypothetical protein ZEAMMB73_Zm00001d029637 [Zea mays]|uniref:Uncharacterized protein n=1 Tax=Zea mays TaxID=4577 RepID=A0A1D6K6E3_MAIZE|nr:hypothetical protein ZEAMMB73_Zm00001d029637 [Zea mays]
MDRSSRFMSSALNLGMKRLGKWQQDYNDVAYLGESPSEASDFIELAQLPGGENTCRKIFLDEQAKMPRKHFRCEG